MLLVARAWWGLRVSLLPVARTWCGRGVSFSCCVPHEAHSWYSASKGSVAGAPSEGKHDPLPRRHIGGHPAWPQGPIMAAPQTRSSHTFLPMFLSCESVRAPLRGGLQECGVITLLPNSCTLGSIMCLTVLIQGFNVASCRNTHSSRPYDAPWCPAMP